MHNGLYEKYRTVCKVTFFYLATDSLSRGLLRFEHGHHQEKQKVGQVEKSLENFVMYEQQCLFLLEKKKRKGKGGAMTLLIDSDVFLISLHSFCSPGCTVTLFLHPKKGKKIILYMFFPDLKCNFQMFVHKDY